MAKIVIAEAVGDDFERILRHFERHDSSSGPRRVAAIASAIDVLETSPLIGRPVENGKRELVIGRGAGGFIALYRYELESDRVVVLAVRAQRESGYKQRVGN
ncbi:MAG: type II toxin-antitoxin system RelE/ParE family toxin [Myxococcaceae bacterium]|nr:type II toxin-antitoxin system RelE/ParE family toxin [Myxococcaceae bacterium]